MIYKIDVGNRTFHVPRVSARDQMKAWGIVTSIVSPKALSASGSDVVLDGKFFTGVFMMAGDEVVSKMGELLLSKATISGESRVVDIEDFQDDIFEYVVLAAEASASHLKGFTSYLQNLNLEIKEEMKKKEGEKVSLTGSS